MAAQEDERKRRSEEMLAAADASMNEFKAGVIAREEHTIDLLEGISKRLESIEQLLRERLNKQ